MNWDRQNMQQQQHQQQQQHSITATRIDDVYDEYRGSKEGLDPPALLRLLVHTLPDLTQGDLMYFQDV
eukprot:1150529-Pelagomonas_calceolata.AAC.5